MNDFEVVVGATQEEAKQEARERAEHFNMLVHSESWKYIKFYVENRIKAFSTRAIKEGFETREQNELERGKVLGLTELVANIENDLKILNEKTS